MEPSTNADRRAARLEPEVPKGRGAGDGTAGAGAASLAGAEGLGASEAAVVAELAVRGVAPEVGSAADLAAGLDRLAELIEDKLAQDHFKERQVAQLHEELQAHRQGVLEKALRPLLMGLVRIHDELGRERDRLPSAQSEEVLQSGQVDALLAGFQDDVELLLEQHGVSRSRSPDDHFDPRLQTAVATVPTDDPERVGAIARRVRAGFERDGTPLRKERVDVFVAGDAGRQVGVPETAPITLILSDEEELR